jgi:hypothetical protein
LLFTLTLVYNLCFFCHLGLNFEGFFTIKIFLANVFKHFLAFLLQMSPNIHLTTHSQLINYNSMAYNKIHENYIHSFDDLLNESFSNFKTPMCTLWIIKLRWVELMKRLGDHLNIEANIPNSNSSIIVLIFHPLQQ